MSTLAKILGWVGGGALAAGQLAANGGVHGVGGILGLIAAALIGAGIHTSSNTGGTN